MSQQDIVSDDDSDSDSVSTASSTHTCGHSTKKIKFSVKVSNLPRECTSQQLLDHFSSYKSAIINKRIKIITPKSQSPSFAFLQFRSLDKANEVIEKMNKTTFQKKKLFLKLQESRGGSQDSLRPTTPASKPSVDSNPTKHSNTAGGGDIVSVCVMNVPNSMDCGDLSGLVAQFQPCNCFIDGQKGTLMFSSSKGASEASKFLNNKLVYGVRLRAVMNKSLLGEPVKSPTSVNPNQQGNRQRGKRSSDPSQVLLSVQHSNRERHPSHGSIIPGPCPPFMPLPPLSPPGPTMPMYGPTGIHLNYGQPPTLHVTRSICSSNDNPVNQRLNYALYCTYSVGHQYTCTLTCVLVSVLPRKKNSREGKA